MMNRESRRIDETDWRLMDELQSNARASFSELADRVGISESDVAGRVQGLEDDGIITGYSANIDTRRAGYTLSALVSLSTNSGNADQIINEELANTPEVVSCWSITGTSDYLLEIQTPSLEFLEELLSELAKHGRLTTSIVLPSSAKKKIIHQPRLSLTD
jgi:Lrp/AsnC family leucine-responsive transcriptional regulator